MYKKSYKIFKLIISILKLLKLLLVFCFGIILEKIIVLMLVIIGYFIYFFNNTLVIIQLLFYDYLRLLPLYFFWTGYLSTFITDIIETKSFSCSVMAYNR